MSSVPHYIVNGYKAFLAFTGLMITTYLLSAGIITTDAGMPIITMIVGYSIGNGIAAGTKKQSEPIIRYEE